jgi:hypothetical protein
VESTPTILTVIADCGEIVLGDDDGEAAAPARVFTGHSPFLLLRDAS